jgi:hypothetical protein
MMIAGRRDRRRSLIRSNAVTSIIARSLSSKNGVAAFQRGSASEFGYNAPVTSYNMSSSQPELTMYLRQLATLHAAGILTDDEFSAARGRLMGS